MPKRKSRLSSKAAASSTPTPETILATRERQLAEIARIRERRGKLAGCAKNAYAMLTRGWAHASWNARAELLRASAWMLHLERLHDLWPEL
jgi:hypothetical protein